jgi:hypothetical protein
VEDFLKVIETMGLGEAGDTAVRSIFAQLDTNKNGRLDFSEALGALEKVKELVSMGKGANGTVAKCMLTFFSICFLNFYFWCQ